MVYGFSTVFLILLYFFVTLNFLGPEDIYSILVLGGIPLLYFFIGSIILLPFWFRRNKNLAKPLKPKTMGVLAIFALSIVAFPLMLFISYILKFLNLPTIGMAYFVLFSYITSLIMLPILVLMGMFLGSIISRFFED